MPNACPLNPHPGGPLANTSRPGSASPRHGDSSLKMTELVNRQSHAGQAAARPNEDAYLVAMG